MQIDLQSSVIKRINKRIIPFLMLLYLIAYIDRSNISVAALQMNADLALTAEMYGIAAGVFYIAYIIFEVPSNIILTRVGAKLWIARIMVTWGIIAAGMSLVQTPTQLYVMRFLLGVAEAGFTQGLFIIFPAGIHAVTGRRRCRCFISVQHSHRLSACLFQALF